MSNMQTVLSISSPRNNDEQVMMTMMMMTDDGAQNHHRDASVADFPKEEETSQRLEEGNNIQHQQQQQQQQHPNNNTQQQQQQQQQLQRDDHRRIRQRGKKRTKRTRLEAETTTTNHHHHHHHSLVDFEKHVMVGLTIAGVASSLLTTTFGVFHVDVFLRAYHLPLPSYSFGSFVFSMINTANDLLGAWIVDHIATRRKRTDLVAWAGILFALCFLIPFFRWQGLENNNNGDDAEQSNNNNNSSSTANTNAFWDLSHFVLSLSAYDTMYSFTAILLGSVVTDNHHMSDKERQAFMASGKVANLFASFAVTRIGLHLFDTTDLTQFRWFLLCLVTVVTIMFVMGQAMIHGNYYNATSTFGVGSFWQQLGQLRNRFQSRLLLLVLNNNNKNYPRTVTPVGGGTDTEKAATTTTTTITTTSSAATDDLPNQQINGGSNQTDKKSDSKFTTNAATTTTAMTMGNKQLRFRRVVQDFWSHKNFRAWIGMEMLLEAQMTFVSHFLKTFVDELLRGEGSMMSPVACDWFISMNRPLVQIAAIVMYIPIRQYGYPVVYKAIFALNIVLSAAVWCFADATSTTWIMIYMLIYPVLTGAIQSAGFHLAMSDMVMELKRDHVLAGRYGEPSLAGLFMGANALLCKPSESLLPIIAATVLDKRGKSSQTLFALLVLPPLVCSVLQLASWMRYDLSPKRTAQMRDELKSLLLEAAAGEVQLLEHEQQQNEYTNSNYYYEDALPTRSL